MYFISSSFVYQFDYLVFIKITENGRELWPLETPPVTPDVLTRTLGMAVETAPHLAMSTVVVLCPVNQSHLGSFITVHMFVVEPGNLCFSKLPGWF